MFLARVRYGGAERWARVEGSELVLLGDDSTGEAGGTLAPLRRAVDGARDASSAHESRDRRPVAGTEILPPVRPGKIVAVGLNYRDHARERGKPLPAEPLLFLKPPSAVIGTGQPIVLPRDVGRVDHEAELAVVIGGRIRRARDDGEARGAILGYTCALDITARELQSRDVQFTRAKGFDSFCPLGPWIRLGAEPPAGVIRCRVGGELRQEASLSEMLFGPEALVRFVSRIMTLLPGDVILTGTPAGVGPVHAGDSVEVEVDGIGSLRCPVIEEAA